MSLTQKFWLVFLVVMLPLGITASSLYGQMEGNPLPSGASPELFQWPPPLEDFEASEEKKGTSESTFVEEAPPATYPPKAPVVKAPLVKARPEKKRVEDLPVFSPPEKRMVKVPARPKKTFADAGDFRDPYFPVRGFQENSEKVLKPGITVDGLQFFSYAGSEKFVENYYRNSNFSLEKVFGKITQNNSLLGCLRCHTGIEEISENHKFKCTQCHGGNRRAKSLASAHKNMVPNPSDLEHAGKYCGKCHADQIKKVEQSQMATAKGVINITRYAWGAQPYGKINYSLRPNPKNTMEASFPPESKKHAVDSFLQTKCLRCHLQAPAPHRAGDYRATGCAACHMVYANDGLTDRKSTRLNSSHTDISRMPSSA